MKHILYGITGLFLLGSVACNSSPKTNGEAKEAETAENLKNLEKFRTIQQKLADPRNLSESEGIILQHWQILQVAHR